MEGTPWLRCWDSSAEAYFWMHSDTGEMVWEAEADREFQSWHGGDGLPGTSAEGACTQALTPTQRNIATTTALECTDSGVGDEAPTATSPAEGGAHQEHRRRHDEPLASSPEVESQATDPYESDS